MYYINENIKDLYRVKFHDNREGVLRLDMNENPGGLPEKVFSAGDGKNHTGVSCNISTER